MNNIFLMGKAYTEPELRHTQSGTAMLRFTMVVDRRYSRLQREQMMKEGKQTCDFIRIVAWGSMAETVGKFLGKGGRLVVSGALAMGRYEKEGGETGYYTEVQADRIQVIDYPARRWGSEQIGGQNDEELLVIEEEREVVMMEGCEEASINPDAELYEA